MEIFEFTVDESFLKESGHPIVIPRCQLPYQRLEAADLDHKHLTVILPEDERFEADLHRRETTNGDHYQLWFASNSTLPGYLKLHDHLLVLLGKTAVQTYAVIEYRIRSKDWLPEGSRFAAQPRPIDPAPAKKPRS